MPSIYFGGSRNLFQHLALPSIVQSAVHAGYSVHVGCQRGADQQVTQACFPSSLVVFAVSPTIAQSPTHVQQAARAGARVVLGAGGSSAPIKAHYLLRSIAAFQGCSQAVFFCPGSGSLAVARECVKSSVPVFAFSVFSPPSPVPSCAGSWVKSQFIGFPCWQWSAAQLSFI